MEELGRPGTIGHNVNRTTAIILMLSCVGYSFNTETFPYCDTNAIKQMWTDMDNMANGDLFHNSRGNTWKIARGVYKTTFQYFATKY